MTTDVHTKDVQDALDAYEENFMGRSSPCAAGADYYCVRCEANVRGISIGPDNKLACPMCRKMPNLGVIANGPRKEANPDDV